MLRKGAAFDTVSDAAIIPASVSGCKDAAIEVWAWVPGCSGVPQVVWIEPVIEILNAYAQRIR